jgi:hypothetical protein
MLVPFQLIILNIFYNIFSFFYLLISSLLILSLNVTPLKEF